MRHRQFPWPPQAAGLARDPAHGRFAGICAGFANYYEFNPGMMRMALVIGCVCGLFLPIIVGYVALVFILPPISRRQDRRASAFAAAQARPDPSQTASLRETFERLDQRLARMEGWVTSEDYLLRQKFKDL